MEILQAADVAALRCRFVNDIYKYIRCLRYSIDCCLDTAKESFLDYKRADSNCTLNTGEYCDLKDKAKTSLVVDCSVELPCESQADVEVKINVSGDVYQSSLITPSFDTDVLPVTSTKADIVLVPNSTVQKAVVTLGVYNQSLNVLDTQIIESGSAKVNGVEVFSEPLYDLRVGTQFDIDGVANYPSSYIRKIRIYYTTATGQYDPMNFWDVDVSPITSPYLSGPGLTTVDFNDLFFTSPNWATALTNVVNNAITVLLGSPYSNYIQFSAYKPINVNRLSLSTMTKHLPSGFWAGLNHNDFRVEYFDSLKGLIGTLTTSSTQAPMRPQGGNIYGRHLFSVGCANLDIELNNSSIVLPLNASTSRFNEIKLFAPQTSQNVTLQTYEGKSCETVALTVTVSSLQSVTSVLWLNPNLTIIGSGFTFYPDSKLPAGTYTVRVQLSSGCTIDKEFYLDEIGSDPDFLTTELSEIITTEDQDNILL
jgi:hypothetical protein